MNTRKHSTLWRSALLFALVASVVMLCFLQSSRKVQKSFTYTQEAFGNPLMGYAPSAWYKEVASDVTLLYVDITWRELEPEEGVFAWDAIEEENQFDRWRAEGKHIVLRFVCDIPGDESHMDIPDWLYEKTGGAGDFYDISYGRGFSPDYSNPEFIACHQRAVAALGQRYGQDTFVSYIELGSLGHWGEWHVKREENLIGMPEQEIRAQYVQHWVEAFPLAKFLMRRPFAEGAQYGLGLYNDMAGHPDSTAEWLDWIYQGGEYSQTGEVDALVPMENAWQTAPIGGEFTSSLPMEQMLIEDLPQTISLLRESHTTFLGPKWPKDDYQGGYDQVLVNMGYRIWISEMELCPRLIGGTKVNLTWQNSGVAPLYWDWPVYLQLFDKEGQLLEQAPVEIALSALLPGQIVQNSVTLSQLDLEDEDIANLQLIVLDPMTGQPALRFADEEGTDGGFALVLWSAL